MKNDYDSHLETAMKEIPVFDCHTHLDSAHLSARGLHEILLYHMVVSDLYSAGCPSGHRVKEGEERERIIGAIPYLKFIHNTSCFWGVRMILSDLYGFEEPLTEKNWESIDKEIRSRSKDPTWAQEVLTRSNVSRSMTEYRFRHDGSKDGILSYCFEETTFCRVGPNQPMDWPMLELERVGEMKVSNLKDVKVALRKYFLKFPWGKVLTFANHLSTDIRYREVRDNEMMDALSHRDKGEVSLADRDVFANYLLQNLLAELEQHAHEIVFQFSFGAEPFVFETGSKLKQDTIFELAELLSRFPRLHFNVFLSSEHASQSLCTVGREHPNLSFSGYWWHNFFPTIIRKVFSERLDMVPVNKQVGFFSDAYCVEWCYAKAAIIRNEMAMVLEEKIERGQYSEETALKIVRQMFWETPQSLLRMSPGSTK